MNDRDETIQKIKSALRRRSGKAWSVTGGRGTAWGWIRIDAVPSRCTWTHRLRAGAVTDRPEDYEEFNAGEPGHGMGPEDRAELGKLMGLDAPAHSQGVSIAASSDYYREFIDRAEGRTPAKVAQPYWDYTRSTPEPMTTTELTEAEEARRGELLAEVLKLKRDRDYRDRWQTTWGTKTNLGLFRMINRIVLDGE